MFRKRTTDPSGLDELLKHSELLPSELENIQKCVKRLRNVQVYMGIFSLLSVGVLTALYFEVVRSKVLSDENYCNSVLAPVSDPTTRVALANHIVGPVTRHPCSQVYLQSLTIDHKPGILESSYQTIKSYFPK